MNSGVKWQDFYNIIVAPIAVQSNRLERVYCPLIVNFEFVSMATDGQIHHLRELPEISATYFILLGLFRE